MVAEDDREDLEEGPSRDTTEPVPSSSFGRGDTALGTDMKSSHPFLSLFFLLFLCGCLIKVADMKVVENAVPDLSECDAGFLGFGHVTPDDRTVYRVLQKSELFRSVEKIPIEPENLRKSKITEIGARYEVDVLIGYEGVCRSGGPCASGSNPVRVGARGSLSEDGPHTSLLVAARANTTPDPLCCTLGIYCIDAETGKKFWKGETVSRLGKDAPGNVLDARFEEEVGRLVARMGEELGSGLKDED